MPTYVYKFVDTGETIEVQQSFSDPTLTEAVHPTTGELLAVKKVFQPVGVTFKGSGFYKTDSRGGSAKRTATDGASGTDTGTAASSTADSSSTSTSSTSASTSSGSSDGGSAAPAAAASPAGS